MSTVSSSEISDFVNDDKPQIPSMLNVLTILTFIGCGIAIISGLALPAIMKFSTTMMDKATSSGAELSTKQLEDIQRGKHMAELTMQNIVPLMITTLVGAALCLLGAIWMRKLKKDGYLIYIAGQVIPYATSLILIGTQQFADWKSYLGLIIPITFIILYGTQRKFMIK